MPRYRRIFGGSVRKNLVLNDCQATILLPVPTLTLCYLKKWQSWQPTQSHQLPLRATSFPSCFSPQDGAACRPCSQPVGRPGTPPPPNPSTTPREGWEAEAQWDPQDHWACRVTHICKKPVFAIALHWPCYWIIAAIKHAGPKSIKVLSVFSTWTNDL